MVGAHLLQIEWIDDLKQFWVNTTLIALGVLHLDIHIQLLPYPSKYFGPQTSGQYGVDAGLIFFAKIMCKENQRSVDIVLMDPWVKIVSRKHFTTVNPDDMVEPRAITLECLGECLVFLFEPQSRHR